MKNLFARLFLLFLLSQSYHSFSQPISKGEYRHLFTQGSLMMLEGFYDTASKVFLKLNTSNPSNANINYKIGVCYLNMPGEKRKAISYLENALKLTKGSFREDGPNEKNAPEDALYNLGKAYHYVYRFDEAIVQLKKFRDLVAKWNLNLVKGIDHWTETCKNAKELTANPVECTITNLGDSVNGEFADYSPVISADESMLVFTSRRMGTGGKLNKTINDKYLEDVWICKRGPYGTWTKAKGISRTINTNNNEATIGLSADGQELYVYRDDNGDGNVYLSSLDGAYWNAPVKMNDNINSKKWEPSACVSADGKIMYFVSDRKGGLGGRDIYQSQLSADGKWSTPENLGPSINTPYDEDAPFLHPDGSTFFFSSTGHNSMGGFDVFYSTKVGNKVWTKPINLGYPINTTDDDIYFVTSSDGRRAYYASFRPEGKGEKDIYMVTFPKAFVKSVAILVGYLKNKDGSTIPKNSLVTAKSSKGHVISNKPNEATGKFVQTLFPGQEYEITVEADGKKVFNETFFLPEDSSYQSLGRGFFQRTIIIGDTAKLFLAKIKSDSMGTSKIVPIDGKILLSMNSTDVAKNLTVQVLNTQGNIIGSAKTDENGHFKFKNISADQKYIIKIDENDPMVKTNQQFYLANNEGGVIMPSVQEGKFFLFKEISPELNKLKTLPAIDTPLSTSIMTGKLSSDSKGTAGLANAKINLLDESGKVIQQKTTDKTGSFKFENLPNDNRYTISIDEKDPTLAISKEIFLSNQQKAIIRKIAKVGNFFVFKNLPTDLNKLNALSFEDVEQLITMRGKILKSLNTTEGLANLSVKLVNSTGKTIQEAKTDALGMFKFEGLATDENYTVQINENDPQLATITKAYLANQGDHVVREIGIDQSFQNLPADLMKLGKLKEIEVTSLAKDGVKEIVHTIPMHPGDEMFDFVIYFPYNKKEIDISVGSFLELMKKVSKVIEQNSKATVIIAASSSTVPTSKYPSNDALSIIRANEIKDKVRSSISLNNIDDTKLTYELSTKVQGPAYKNDAMKNRLEYEKWQFVKVIVR